MYADNSDFLAPLLDATLDTINRGGHTVFPTGPFPLRGVIFDHERAMFHKFSERAPDAGNLLRLFGIDGDYRDDPIPLHDYWTGEFDPSALTIRDAIEHANGEGDYALCDTLIACWILYCAVFNQLPLPDVVGLAKCISALPADHRASTYATAWNTRRRQPL